MLPKGDQGSETRGHPSTSSIRLRSRQPRLAAGATPWVLPPSAKPIPTCLRIAAGLVLAPVNAIRQIANHDYAVPWDIGSIKGYGRDQR